MNLQTTSLSTVLWVTAMVAVMVFLLPWAGSTPHQDCALGVCLEGCRMPMCVPPGSAVEAGRLGGGQKSCGGIRPIFCMSVEGSGAARLREETVPCLASSSRP